MKINLANGIFFKHKLDFNKQAKLFSQIDIDGVELTFRYLEELDLCLKNSSFLDFLSTFKSNTIHAPFGKKPDIKIYKKENIDEILDKFKKIKDKINVKNIVFHPYNFENLNLLERINEDLFSIENTITENLNCNKLRKLFENYENLRFTLDTSHATFISKDEFDSLFDNLKDKIKTIHLSNAWKDNQHKQFFNNEGISRFLKIKDLKEETILTIEEDFDDISVGIITKEINFVKNWIKSP